MKTARQQGAEAREYRRSVKNKEDQKRWRESARGRAYKNKQTTERRLRARAAINQFKSRPCADCGGTFDPVCMDFDHRPGEEKRGNVSGLVTRNFSRILVEIQKCDVVCANCHRIRTKVRGWSPRPPREALEKVQLGLGLPEATS